MRQINPTKHRWAQGGERRPSFGWLCCVVRRTCRRLGPQAARKRVGVRLSGDGDKPWAAPQAAITRVCAIARELCLLRQNHLDNTEAASVSIKCKKNPLCNGNAVR